MSEYQYYEFQSIDRPLTDAEIKKINSWSSRANVSRRRATFEYNYSDFPKSFEKVTLQYFDAAYYIANWGTKKVIFRLPIDLVDFDELKKFHLTPEHLEESLNVSKKGKYVLIEMYLDDDNHDWGWIEGAGSLDSLLPIRAAILEGDYSALFAFWLKLRATVNGFDYEDDPEDFEIPLDFIPDNLHKKNRALEEFIDFFEVDEDWVSAAAKYKKSSNLPKVDLHKALQSLAPSIKDDYLLRLLNGETNLALKLKKELTQSTTKKTKKSQETIAFSILVEDAEVVYERRKKEYEKQQEKERIARLESIIKRKSAIKKSIKEEIEDAKGKAYSRAMKSILELQEAAIYQNKEKAFEKYIADIKEMCTRKPAMLKRLRENGL